MGGRGVQGFSLASAKHGDDGFPSQLMPSFGCRRSSACGDQRSKRDAPVRLGAGDVDGFDFAGMTVDRDGQRMTADFAILDRRITSGRSVRASPENGSAIGAHYLDLFFEVHSRNQTRKTPSDERKVSSERRSDSGPLPLTTSDKAVSGQQLITDYRLLITDHRLLPTLLLGRVGARFAILCSAGIRSGDERTAG
jgi:hypothetical protein